MSNAVVEYLQWHFKKAGQHDFAEQIGINLVLVALQGLLRVCSVMPNYNEVIICVAMKCMGLKTPYDEEPRVSVRQVMWLHVPAD